MRGCTIQGRIVYDRKKHYFTIKDAIRIATAVEPGYEKIEFVDLQPYLALYLVAWGHLVKSLLNLSITVDRVGIGQVLRFLGEKYIEVLMQFIERIPGVVLSIVGELFSTIVIEKE